MSARAYVSDAGDIVWVNFDPQAGHEQEGHRPAVVVSLASYNGRTSLMLCCPMTTTVKDYPFEVAIVGERKSVALADQVRSVDWRARGARRKGKASARELATIRGFARALIGQ